MCNKQGFTLILYDADNKQKMTVIYFETAEKLLECYEKYEFGKDECLIFEGELKSRKMKTMLVLETVKNKD